MNKNKVIKSEKKNITTKKAIQSNPKFYEENINKSNKNVNSKVNINVIKNDLSNSANYVKTLVPKSKETPKNINQVQKQVKKLITLKK